MALSKDEQQALQQVRDYARKNNVGYSLRGGARRDKHGEAEGLVTRPDQFVGLHASTEILTKDIATILTKRMPGFRWAIQPNEAGKVFNIFCLDLHGIWGYVIRYDDIMNDPQRREAVKAGREILRRFGYHGTRYDAAQMAQIPRNVKGEAIPRVSDMKASRFTKKAELELKVATGKATVIGHRGGGQIIQVEE